MGVWCWIAVNKDILQTIAACIGAVFALLGTAVAVFAWRAAVASAEAARTSAETARMAERAYLNLSHVPPGLLISPIEGSDAVGIRARVQVKNNGRTPAETKRSAVTMWIGKELPPEPPYSQGAEADETFSLPASDHFFQHYSHQIRSDVWEQVTQGTLKAWLIAYVEYTDTFRRRHRAGYTRLYAPEHSDETGANLIFELKAGYNYDRDVL